MYTCSISRLNNDVAASSTLVYFSGTARLGECTMNYGRFPNGFPTQIPWTRWTLFSVRFLFFSFSFLQFGFFLLLFVLFVCVLEYAVITSLLMFWAFHVLPDLIQLSFYTFDLFTFKLCWTERVWHRVPSNLSTWHSIFLPFLCALW